MRLTMIVAVAVAGLTLTACSTTTLAEPDQEATEAPVTAAPGEATETSPPGSGGSGKASENPDVAPAGRKVLPPAGFAKTVSYGDKVSVRVTGVRNQEIPAQGPGEVAGQGTTVSLKLLNKSDRPVPLDTVIVTLTHGPDNTPAIPGGAPPSNPFSGTLRPGEAAEAKYAFILDSGDRRDVQLLVSYSPDAPLALFAGPLA